jgi:hypothetical protein
MAHTPMVMGSSSFTGAFTLPRLRCMVRPGWVGLTALTAFTEKKEEDV